MTPEAIRTLSELREKFYPLFAAAMKPPVSIKKETTLIFNPSLASVASWVDDLQRLNFLRIFAHTAPDALIPERPLLLRLSINQQCRTSARVVKRKTGLTLNQDWQFELTVQPEEILNFAEWVANWINCQDNSVSVLQDPPYRLKFLSSNQGLSCQAWTQTAWRSLDLEPDTTVQTKEQFGQTVAIKPPVLQLLQGEAAGLVAI